jgi:two-component system secretion system sensor histidine kinase SalK
MNIYIREQMQNYHPVLLSKLTIKENYQNLLAYIAQSFPERHISIVFDCPASLFLVPPYDIFIYRLLKELVTNVYKHSTGEKAWITLTQDNGMIVLCVKDNGSADADSLTNADSSKHRGLALSADRVHSMDGTVSITPNFPRGICVCISLPMKGDASYQYFISR